ncbi:MAG: type 1 glutamine amidotransferase [Nitrososphaerota archaeon]|nr:type 1 glutamine amidotransferase [Nitrososphaerota archaeon]MDG6966450.1 type 1 glutamine amidotransferase [Nitrososphaerota archaeon]MDG7020874.1 type 1 glutamine amidotransferase [Nitrososphaerota archaeon]
MRPCVLVVQNAEWEGPGLIGLHARSAGVGLAKAELFRHGEVIPLARLEAGAFCAVVALGSPSTAYLPETNPNHSQLVRLFRAVREHGIPSFNVCYSMQLFSIVHGGSVVRNPLGKEVGLADVSPTRAGGADPVIGGLGRFTTLQWHGDVVDRLPEGALHLAYSKKTKHQVAVLDGIHYLVQADGQAATPAMVGSWIRHDSAWATRGTGVVASSLLLEVTRRQAYLRNTFLRMFANFLGLALSGGGLAGR